MKSRRTSHCQGFTLIEVLVALVIMSIMAVMAWQGVDGIVRTRNASQARLEQTLRLNTVMSQWDRDLSTIQDSGALPDTLRCDGQSVRLTRRTPDGLQVVTWSLRPGSNGDSLVRWASPPATTVGQLSESWMRSQLLQGDEPGSLRTLTGLSAWKVYFFQGNAWANCQSTGDFSVPVATSASGPSPAGSASGIGGPRPKQSLPTGVRMVLSFAPGSGLSGDLTRDTQLGP
jgi:general secretion pathway protein J